MEKHTGFQLDIQTGYFKNNGVDVMAFMDIYPAVSYTHLTLPTIA